MGNRKWTVVLFFVILAQIILGQTLKIGLLAPQGSPWYDAARKIDQEWRRISQGRFRLKIYGGGILGSEVDMVRKIRIGQIDGAIVSTAGLSQILPEIMALSLPFLVNNDNELEFLLQKLTPEFDAKFSAKGFKAIAWGKGGWINFFSKKPIVYPDDLRGQTLAVTASEPELIQAWRSLGFDAVPLSSKDILPGLQSGLIDAYFAPPLVSAVYQWFALAPNMCSLKLAPLIGGFILNNRRWDRIPDSMKAELIERTNSIVTELYYDTTLLEQKAIQTMLAHGLVINQVPPSALKDWKAVVEQGYNSFVGKTFSKEFFQKVKTYLDEYHRSQ